MNLRFNKILLPITVVFIIVFLFQMCANPVSPTGGPKDITPPVLLEADPPLFSKNFTSTRIRLYFDEFIVIKDLLNQLIISPPLYELPDIKVKGKSLIIDLKEELKENTTYNFYFGEAIVDLNENNPIRNFQYIFSTGNILDSLSIQGNIFSAFNLEPVAGVNIMLYPDNNDTIAFDSLPYLVRPFYLTKSGENGDYRLTNLKNEQYLIFALMDMNNNLIYDQPTEGIAFSDSLINPWYIEPMKVDSIPLDTIMAADTVLQVDSILLDTTSRTDSTLINDQLKQLLQDTVPDRFIDLALFNETDSTQKLLKRGLLKESLIYFVFNTEIRNVRVKSFNHDNNNWFIPEYNSSKDTVFYWLKNIDTDSLKLEISDNNFVLDTVDIRIKKPQKRALIKAKEKAERKLQVNFNLNGNVLLLNKPLELTFSYPVENYYTDSLILIESEDTLNPDFIFIDDIHRRGMINYPWKEATKYQLIIPDSSFYDIHGITQDSIQTGFSTKAINDYGNLTMDIKPERSGQYIIQLIKDDNVITEYIITNSEQLSFALLEPASYKLKAIYDFNKNGKWDAGSFASRIQPEKVAFFSISITIRASWDNEEEWILE